MKFNPLEIIAAPEDEAPFQPEGVASEQDTFLLMGKDQIEYPIENIGQLSIQMYETPAFSPGTVLVRGEDPFRFLGIVHDINQIPTWREEWIISVFHKIFEESEKRGIQSLGIPLLGTLYGTLEKQRCADLLMTAVKKAELVYLKRLWIIIHLQIIEISRRGNHPWLPES